MRIYLREVPSPWGGGWVLSLPSWGWRRGDPSGLAKRWGPKRPPAETERSVSGAWAAIPPTLCPQELENRQGRGRRRGRSGGGGGAGRKEGCRGLSHVEVPAGPRRPHIHSRQGPLPIHPFCTHPVQLQRPEPLSWPMAPIEAARSRGGQKARAWTWRDLPWAFRPRHTQQ